MLKSGEITVKQLLFLIINKGFLDCEVWDEIDYIRVTHGSKNEPDL